MLKQTSDEHYYVHNNGTYSLSLPCVRVVVSGGSVLVVRVLLLLLVLAERQGNSDLYLSLSQSLMTYV